MHHADDPGGGGCRSVAHVRAVIAGRKAARARAAVRVPWAEHVLRAFAVVASGLLFGLAFPPVAFRPIAWTAFVPALVALRRARPAAAIGLAALFAAACTAATVDWLPRTVARYYEQPWVVGLGLFVGITLVMVVPPWIAFASVYRALAARTARGFAPLAAAAWVAAEFGRANLWTGNPWVLFGYTQIDAVHLAQVADLTGVYGLSFVVAWVNIAVAELWLARAEPKRRRIAMGSLACALGVVAGMWCYGRIWLAALAGDANAGTAVEVAVVQDNLDLGPRWRPGMELQTLEAYLHLTHDVLQDGRPRLVVWPELAMTFFVEHEPYYRAALAVELAPAGTEVLTGGLHLLGSKDEPRYLNSAFVLSPRGEILGRYDKEQLVPFMEYFPFPRLDFMRRRFARARVLTPGAPVPPLPTPAGPVGVTICNEALFPGFTRAHVRAGAVWLAVLTNDSWLRDAKFSGIAFDMARMRAIETRRWLVRASTWGPSAVVDAAGRVLMATALGTTAVTQAAVRPRRDLTPYVRFGDAFAVLCVVAVGLTLVVRRSRRG